MNLGIKINSLNDFIKEINSKAKSQMYFNGIGEEPFSIVIWYSSSFGKEKSFYYAEIYGEENFKRTFKEKTKEKLYNKMSKTLGLLGLGENKKLNIYN